MFSSVSHIYSLLWPFNSLTSQKIELLIVDVEIGNDSDC